MPDSLGILFRVHTSPIVRLSVAFLIFVSCSSAVLVGSDSVVELNLSNATASEDIWVTSSRFVLPSLKELVVRVTDFPISSGFSVVHIHCFPPLSDIVVKHNATNLIGSDLGFVYPVALGSTVVNLTNPLPWSVEVLIVVRTYDESYSVPGGCAMEFPTKIAPYLVVQKGNETIAVKGQKGAETINDHLCLNNDLEYEFYYSYTSETVETANQHFNRLQSILNYSEIVDWTYEARWMGGSPTQRVFAKYPGVCTYYAMAVKNKLGRVSLYSPSSSMLCRQEEISVMSIGTKALLATLLPIGLILCFAGHSVFVLPFSIFCTTGLAGYQLSYVGLTDSGFSPEDAYSWAFFIAVGIAVVVLFFLLAFTFPLLWLVIPAGAVGYLLVVAAYFLFAGNLAQFSSGPTYWGVLIALTVGIAGLFVFVPAYGCIASLALIGSYLVAYVISQIMGTRFHYVTINPVRRLTVEGFDSAITSPPLETSDIVMFGLWISLAISGFEKQRRRARGRAPLPPPPRLFSRSPEESRPLLLSTDEKNEREVPDFP
ncbi:hypothetical protein GE061_001175 [Apolygus lucorum]|uniref:TM7S3/TM198-like domain-containing protein n=1 Tax=Apolygus lucorum TaxID=248454 RepID=A0A6A4K0W2_APOLU|nr:hypothetical protein GE061_001175 [Apolygus lucorum]